MPLNKLIQLQAIVQNYPITYFLINKNETPNSTSKGLRVFARKFSTQ